jgi:hypothetical protein
MSSFSTPSVTNSCYSFPKKPMSLEENLVSCAEPSKKQLSGLEGLPGELLI